jgi:hypothetical protein
MAGLGGALAASCRLLFALPRRSLSSLRKAGRGDLPMSSAGGGPRLDRRRERRVLINSRVMVMVAA